MSHEYSLLSLCIRIIGIHFNMMENKREYYFSLTIKLMVMMLNTKFLHVMRQSTLHSLKPTVKGQGRVSHKQCTQGIECGQPWDSWGL